MRAFRSPASLEDFGILTKSQFLDTRRNPEGMAIAAERKLLFAALEDGIRCFLGFVEAAGMDWAYRESIKREAIEWVLDDSPATPYGFTFTQLAREFGFDPGALREALMRARSVGLQLPNRPFAVKGIKNDVIVAEGHRSKKAA